LSGNPPKGRKKGKNAPTNAGTGTPPSLLTMREGSAGGGKGPLISEDISLTLATGNNQVLFGETGFAKYTENELKTLNATQHKRGTENVVVREVKKSSK
jgi:hypothetical protein